MVIEDKKLLLIVEDDQPTLEIYKEMLGEIYNVTPVCYIKGETKIPTEKFYGAILDGLNDEWGNVGEQISAKKKILVSGNLEYIKTALELGWLVLDKPFRESKLLEILR